MAGSLNVPPESKAVGYCCFIVVMPAEGTVSAGLSLLHSRGSLGVSAVPPNRSPDKRGGVWGGWVLGGGKLGKLAALTGNWISLTRIWVWTGVLGNRLPARERTLQESLQESRGSYAKISRSVSLSWRANAWFTESVDRTRLIMFVSLLFLSLSFVGFSLPLSHFYTLFVFYV